MYIHFGISTVQNSNKESAPKTPRKDFNELQHIENNGAFLYIMRIKDLSEETQ